LKLRVDEITNYIQKGRFKWFGHVKRMTEDSIPKKMLHTEMEGKRPRERPTTDGQDKSERIEK
jgi:hypothetical protein